MKNNFKNISELHPMKDTRKSFYGKALVEAKGNGNFVLYSYCTPICEVKDDDYTLNTKVPQDLLFSYTSLRHIKEFLFQYLGLENLKKSDLVEHTKKASQRKEK